MAVSRRDLLLAGFQPKITEQERKKAEDNLEEGAAYTIMKETYGWRLLMENFIGPKLQKDLFFQAADSDLPKVRAEMRALNEMVDYVERKIKEATKAAEKLEEHK